MTRSIQTAQHEAAHVVVGCALGLRLAWARIYPPPGHCLGETQFGATSRSHATGIMYAAGIAWEIASGGNIRSASVDRRLAREQLRREDERADIRAAVLCADAILHSRMALHARVSRLLAERDITGADVRALIERLG